MNTLPYHIICKSLSGIETIVEELASEGISPKDCDNTTLSRTVEVVDYLNLSDTTTLVELTREEADLLRGDERVESIELYRPSEPILHDLPPQQTQTFMSLSGLYNRDVGRFDENWGLSFCSTVTAVSSSSFKYMYTGEGVDVVILDTGITDNHPEWLSKKTGVSRLQKINWSLFFPLTSNTSISVSVSTFDGKREYVFNGQRKPIWYIISDITNTTQNITRRPVYTFTLDNTVSGFPFTITTSTGSPVTGTHISRNGSSTGTIRLTAVPSNVAGFFNNLNYTCLTSAGMGNMLVKTKYNTQTSNYYSDADGHGTHTTGTVAGSSFGWAKEANIYSLKMFADNVSNSYTPLEALDLARLLFLQNKRPMVTNNSWGYNITSNNPYGGQQASVDAAVKLLIDTGVHFVHSAGNDSRRVLLTPTLSTFGSANFNTVGYWNNNGPDYIHRETSPHYPFADWGVNDSLNPGWCVGSLGRVRASTTDNYFNDFNLVADYSNVGTGITVYAPGSYIASSYPNRQVTGTSSSSNTVLYRNSTNFYMRKISGTSMAGPQVAGIIATYLQANSGVSPLSAKNYLMNNVLVNYIDNNPIYPSLNIRSNNNYTISQYPLFNIIHNLNTNCLSFNDLCYSNTNNRLNIPLSSGVVSNFNTMLNSIAVSANCSTCNN